MGCCLGLSVWDCVLMCLLVALITLDLLLTFNFLDYFIVCLFDYLGVC